MPSAGYVHNVVDSGIVKAGVTVTAGLALVHATSGALELQLGGTSSRHIAGVAAIDAAAGAAVTVVSEGRTLVSVKNGETLTYGDALALAANGQWAKASGSGALYFAVCLGTTAGTTGETVMADLLGKTPATLA